MNKEYIYLGVPPQFNPSIFQFFGATCTYEGIKVPQYLAKKDKINNSQSSELTVQLILPKELWNSYIQRVLTSPCRMMIDVLDPKVERIPAISTAIYPAPTITLRLHRQTQTMLSRGHTDTNFSVTCLQGVSQPCSVTHFGRVSSSKKPSLVMPRFAPMKRKGKKKC